MTKETGRTIDSHLHDIRLGYTLTNTILVIGLAATYGIGRLNDRPPAPAGIYLPCVDPQKKIPCPAYEYEMPIPSDTATLMANPHLFRWRNGPLREMQVAVLEYDTDHPPQTVVPNSAKLYALPDEKSEEKRELAEGEALSWRFELLVGNDIFALVDEYVDTLTVMATTYSEKYSHPFMNGHFLPLFVDGKNVIDLDYSEVYIPKVTPWVTPRG